MFFWVRLHPWISCPLVLGDERRQWPGASEICSTPGGEVNRGRAALLLALLWNFSVC